MQEEGGKIVKRKEEGVLRSGKVIPFNINGIFALTKCRTSGS
jgi:hypothetical protein